MKFRLSHSYIEQKARQTIFPCRPIWSFSSGGVSGAHVTLAMVIPAWKQRCGWQKYGASIEVEVTPDGIIQKEADCESTIKKEAIGSALIQENHRGISSLFFQSETEATEKLESYKNIEQLASAIEGLVGSQKLWRKRRLHR